MDCDNDDIIVGSSMNSNQSIVVIDSDYQMMLDEPTNYHQEEQVENNIDYSNGVAMVDMVDDNVDVGDSTPMTSTTHSEQKYRVYLNEFVFTEHEFVNNEKHKEYRKTNIKSCGWLKKKRASIPFLDNSDVCIELDPNGEYVIEKLLLLQLHNEKIPKKFYLERAIPEFLVVSSGSLHIGAKLKKLAAITATQETVDRIVKISSFIQNRLIQEWSEQLLREDVVILPFVTTKNRTCTDYSLDSILQLDVLEHFFTNTCSLVSDPKFESKLSNPRGLLARCEQTFDYAILAGYNDQRQLIGNKLSKETLRKAMKDPQLLSYKTADIVINPNYVSFPRFGLELIDQLREQFALKLHVITEMTHYSKLGDYYCNKFSQYHFFRDPLILRMAHTFTSYSHKMNFGRYHYERLEFMGDAIVNLTAGTELIKMCRNDDSKRGDWNFGYSVLIANDSITREAEKLQINDLFLNFATNIAKKGQSNVVESLVGVLGVSGGGMGEAISFTKELLIPTTIDFKCMKKYHSDFPAVPTDGENWKRNLQQQEQPLFIGQDVIDSLQDMLQYRFKNVNLLQEALVACTYNNTFMDLRTVTMTERIEKFLKRRNDNKIVGVHHLYNNEQLKLLGAAILKLMVTEYVYKRFTEAQPNKLTLLAHQIISKQGKVFTAIHEKTKLYRFLLKSNDNNNTTIVGGDEYPELHQSYDCFVALLGAIYIDQDCTLFRLKLDTISEEYKKELANSTDPCSSYFLKRHDITPNNFFYNFFFPHVEEFGLSPYIVEQPKKHQLQHLIQVNYKLVPVYERKQDVSLAELGLEFSVIIKVNEQEFCQGFSAKSFAEAEELAIENGLKKFRDLTITTDSTNLDVTNLSQIL